MVTSATICCVMKLLLYQFLLCWQCGHNNILDTPTEENILARWSGLSCPLVVIRE